MKRSAALLRTIVAAIFLANLFAQFAQIGAMADEAKPEESNEPKTGLLQIYLNASDTGAYIGGACWDVTDANGARRSACDSDGDGLTTLGDLPAGWTTARQSTPAASGYEWNAYGNATVVAGGVARLQLTNKPLPPAPAAVEEEPETTEPVEEPAEVNLAEESSEPAEVVNEDEQPAETEPVDEGEQPAETEPVDEGEQPAETEPVDEGEQPAETEPVDEGEQPAETEPVDEGEQPAEETEPIDEGEQPEETEPVDEGEPSAKPEEGEESSEPQESEEGDPSDLMRGFDSFSMDASLFDLANDDFFSIGCEYNNQTGTSSFTFSVVKADPSHPDTNDPGLTIVFQPYDLLMNPLATISSSNYQNAFPNTTWRRLEVTLNRHGTPGEAFAMCNTSQVQPTISTKPMGFIGGLWQEIPQNTGVPVGTELKDTALMQGQTITATGTATYRLYRGSQCTAEFLAFTSTVSVNNGLIPDSATTAALNLAPGLYNWQVTYNGDSLNRTATSTCGLETLIIGKMTPTIQTVMRQTNAQGEGNTVIPHNGSVGLDNYVNDQGVLSNFSPTAGGDMIYELYDSANCAGTPIHTSTRQVTNGVAPRSTVYFVSQPGTYNWIVRYTGDSLNEAVTSGCGAETFNVVKRSPTITTTMRRVGTPDTTINQNGTVPFGSTAYDQSQLNNATSDASGKVTYYLFRQGQCNLNDTNYLGKWEVQKPAGGAIPNSGTFTFLEAGTYDWLAVYEGDTRNNGANSGCGNERMTVGKVNTTTTTAPMRIVSGNAVPVAQNEVIPNPSTVFDTATVTPAGGITNPVPTGTVTFRLYQGDSCSGNPFFPPLVVTLVNGAIPLSAVQNSPYEITTNGTYNWQAQYSGDANFNGSTSDCGAERFHVGKGTGTISTQVQRRNNGDTNWTDVNDGGNVPINWPVRDTATVQGFTPNAGGQVVFSVYAGSGQNACNGQALASYTVTMVNGVIPPSAPNAAAAHYFTATGSYEWQAHYLGDANNEEAKSPCGSETVSVVLRGTSTATTMRNAGGVIANNSTFLVPFSMWDTAQITRALTPYQLTLTGTITYRIYTNTNCTTLLPGAEFQYTIGGDGSIPNSHAAPGIELTDAITYRWRAFYSGDANHAASESPCDGEVVHGQKQPTISTIHYGNGTMITPNGAAIAFGSTVYDTAQFGAGTFSATPHSQSATVTYRLYANEDCSGSSVHTSTVNVQSNGSIPNSSSFTPQFSGVYNWVASYSGNNTNRPVASVCGDEKFIVLEGTGSLTTSMYAHQSSPNQNNHTTLAQGSQLQLPAYVSDRTTILGTPSNHPGKIRYELFRSENCAPASKVFDSGDLTVTDITSIPNSGSFQAVDYGVYNWVVTFTPNDTNYSPLVSGCGQETFIGVEHVVRTIRIVCTLTPALPFDLSTFQIIVAKTATSDPDVDPRLTVVVTPFGLDNSQLPTITYHMYDSDLNAPPPNPAFFQQPWRSVSVHVTWPDNETGTASGGCNTSRLTPTIETVMVDKDGNTVANGTELAIGDQIGDTVRLNGATINFGGSFEYRLYNNANCTGDPVNTFDLQPILTPAALPPSALHTLTAGGDYNWVVHYSGDIHNMPVTSGCGEEFFSVKRSPTTITTKVKVGTTVIPDDGTVPVGAAVFDTAELAGNTANAGGTVTYQLYDSADCSGNPVETFERTVTNGSIEDSGTYLAQAGKTYNWVVTYSGDASNAGSVSACGKETFLTPKLRIEKINDSGASSVDAGTQIAFKIVLTNDGPGIAVGAKITDTLPVGDGLSWSLDAGASSANCAVSAGVLTCQPRDLAAGGTITARVTSGTGTVCGPVRNVAEYDSTNAGNGSSNEAEVNINCADIGVEKTPNNGTVYPGETATFTIVVTNYGPGLARGVKVNDFELPDGTWNIEIVSAPQGAACPPTASASFECTIGDMANGATATIKVSRQVGHADCGPLVNKVRVKADNESPNATEPNEDDGKITVECVDIGVEKTPNNGFIYPGESAVFTIVVTNYGPAIAKGVKLDDFELPDGQWTVEIVSAPQGASCPTGLVEGDFICTIGDMANGATATIKVSREVTGDDCGPLVNKVRVSADNESPNGTKPNEDDGKITVKCSEIGVEKSPNNGFIYPGETATFTIVVTNYGPYEAIEVAVDDFKLPKGTWNVETTQGTCDTPATGSFECELGTIAKDGTVTITVSRTVTTADCGELKNEVRVSSPNEDPKRKNEHPNEDDGKITVKCAEIGVEKTPVEDAVYPGETAAFKIVVTNYGPYEAIGVEVDDFKLPQGTWTVTTTQGTCETPATDSFTCELGTIAKDGTVTITVSRTATTADCGDLKNEVRISAKNELPENTKPNQDDAKITVKCSDIGVIKLPDNGFVLPGDNAAFLIVVTNYGPYPAIGVTLTDTLPDDEQWIVLTVDGLCNTATPGQFTCNLGTIGVLRSAFITVVRIATTEDCGELKNTVTVAAANEKPNDVHKNTDTGKLTVTCSDLEVIKTPDNGIAYPGGEAVFTIVLKNHGPYAATAVRLNEKLPPGLWNVSSDRGGCTTLVSGTFTCFWGELETNGTITITIKRQVTVADCGPLVNEVEVFASNERADQTKPNEDTGKIDVACTDIGVEKTPDDGEVNPGGTARFDIVVTNHGDHVAKDVVLRDRKLPAGTWTITAPQGVTCPATASGSFTCTIGDIPVLGNVTVTVSRVVTTADCGDLVNEVEVSASNELPNQTKPNEDTGKITVTCTDIGVEKTPDNGKVNPGGTATFDIVVTNYGPHLAKDVSLNDRKLPAGTWTIGAPDGVVCPATASGSFTCTIGDLAVGAPVTITVSRAVTTDDCGDLVNEVEVSASNEDPNGQQPNEDTGKIEVTCSEIGVEKTPNDGEVNPGGTATFTIVVTNYGPHLAKDVSLNDRKLPAGTWTITAPEGVTCPATAEGSFRCEIGDLAVGAPVTITVSRAVTTDDCGDLVNEVEVSASNEDPEREDEHPNEDDGKITVTCSEIGVEKTPNDGKVDPGNTATFDIVVTNYGPHTAKDVVLKDTKLPVGTWTIGAPEGVVCPATATGSFTCTIGDIPAGGNVTVTVSRLVTTDDCGDLVNEVEVSASNEDPEREDEHPNEDDGKITVTCSEIGVEKTPNDGEVNPGSTATFTIVVTNYGPHTAKDVSLNDRKLPAGTWTITAPDGVVCPATAEGSFRCEIGDLAVGAPVTITVSRVATTDDCGDLVNEVEVSASNEDPEREDEHPNEDDGKIEVTCSEIGVEKTPNDGEVNPGGTATFTIVVTNYGPHLAKDVSLNDRKLPAGTWTITAPEGVTCPATAEGSFRCEIGDLAVGAPVTITVSRVVTTDDCGDLVNEVEVSASNEDPEREDEHPNEDDGKIEVTCTDIGVEKTPDGTSINAGEMATFTIVVTNHGPHLAKDVVLDDTKLPVGEWTIGAPEGVTCPATAEGSFRCEIGDLAVGAPVTITVSRLTDASDCSDLVNEVKVSASNEDPDGEESNEDDGSMKVNCPDLGIRKTGNAPSVAAGSPISFEIEITNNGEGDAVDVVLTDKLPMVAGIEWSIATPVEGCSLNAAKDTLTCEFELLAAGDAKTVTVNGVTQPGQCALVSNTVTVTAANEATEDEDDNSATTTIAINCPVTVIKIGDGGARLPGVTFELRGSGGVVFGPATTDSNGIASFTNVPVGSYSLVETAAPEGYVISGPVAVEVVYGSATEIELENLLATVEIPVFKLDCVTDPGAVSLEALKASASYAPKGCVRVPGVTFHATQNGQQINGDFVTGANGSVTIPVKVFTKLVITEDLTTATPGFLPRQNPITIDPVPVTGGGAVFVNLAQDGELKLLKLVCKSDKKLPPKFEVVDAKSFGVTDKSCWLGVNVAFTISGGGLSTPITLSTGRDGVLTVGLKAGVYTITEVSTGASATVEVKVNTTTLLKVTNYKLPKKPEEPKDPDPTPTTPVEKLPDTGAGDLAMAGGNWLLLLAMLLLGGLAMFFAMTIGLRRQRQS